MVRNDDDDAILASSLSALQAARTVLVLFLPVGGAHVAVHSPASSKERCTRSRFEC